MVDVAAVEQGRVEGIEDGTLDAVITAGTAYRHDGASTVAHGGLDVAEVEVDIAGRTDGDEFGDTLHSILQHIVGLGQGILERHLRVAIHIAQLLVVHNEHGIDIAAEFVDALEGLYYLATVLEIEGDGDDANGQQSALLGHPGHDRSGTSTRATTHRSGDKHHLGLRVYQALNHVYAALGFRTANLRTTASTKTFAQLQLHRYWRMLERGTIGIAHGKGYALNTFMIHAADGIAATATHANHLDDVLHQVLDGTKIQYSYIFFHIACKVTKYN